MEGVRTGRVGNLPRPIRMNATSVSDRERHLSTGEDFGADGLAWTQTAETNSLPLWRGTLYGIGLWGFYSLPEMLLAEPDLRLCFRDRACGWDRS